MKNVEISISKRQAAFLDAKADEVLFGGAAGGGKSYAQMIDALNYAIQYPGSRQLILRRTFPELEKSLIRVAQAIYPRDIFKYNASKYCGTFTNGSRIDFGHCHAEDDVYKYQSAEYDVIRFDELTHFSEFMYRYLLSRVRGANDFPKMVKSSTNPGGVGHAWVKERFIDIGEPDKVHSLPGGTRIYLPAKIQDNSFLMRSDPDYIKRLKNLPARERRALLHGDWDIFEGQYFTEWRRDVHVVRPFEIPKSWRRYFTMDYGLDMLAGYWIALDDAGGAYVYREVYKSGLIISEAAREILAHDDACVHTYFAPPDLWNRRQDTGKSAAQIFFECGVPLTRAENDRVQGWLALREWLKPRKNEFGETTPQLRIFENCVNLIRTLPAVTVDKLKPSDVAREPHELTHAPDAIRYFVAGRPHRGGENAKPRFEREVEAFLDYGT